MRHLKHWQKDYRLPIQNDLKNLPTCRYSYHMHINSTPYLNNNYRVLFNSGGLGDTAGQRTNTIQAYITANLTTT